MQNKVYLEKVDLKNYFKKYKISLRKILGNVFGQEVRKLTYLENYKMIKMPEYKFNLLKFNVVLNDFKNYSVFIRLMQPHKIEENLFCYWLFCHEYFSINEKKYKSKANIVNIKYQGYEKRYELQLFKKRKEICDSSFVEVINLKKYCKKDIKDELFIAII